MCSLWCPPSCSCRFQCAGDTLHQVHDGKYPLADSACISDLSSWLQLSLSPSLSLPPSFSLCHSSSSCCSAVQWHCRLNLRPVKPVKCQTSENFTFYNLTQSQFQNGTNLFCFISLQICGSRVSEHSQGWLVKLTATFLASRAQYLWKSPSTVLDIWLHFVTFKINSVLCANNPH